MTAPASSIHKKLIFASAGCAAVLVVVAIIALVGVRHLGFEPPPAPRYASPALARAALDSLARTDFSRWLEPRSALAQLRCRETQSSLRVAPAPPTDSLSPPIAFGDTFPPGSAARRIWEGFGMSVGIEPAAGGGTPGESLPPSRTLLAAVRVQLNRGDRTRACVTLGAVVDKADGLEAETQLDRVVAGAWLARDAASMVSRDTVLQVMTGLAPAQAAALLGALDARKLRLVEMRRLIEAASVSPASVDSLAAWVSDVQLPVPVRRAYVEAIGYGWVLDPPEVTFTISGARGAALSRLLQDTLPDALRETAVAARQVLQGNLAQRFQFAVAYRTRRAILP